MIDSEVLRVSNINQAVITAPPVPVDDRSKRDATTNNGLQGDFLAVRHDFCVNAPITFENAEDNGLAGSATASLASDTASAEIGLVNFNFARGEGRGALTFFRD